MIRAYENLANAIVEQAGKDYLTQIDGEWLLRNLEGEFA